VDLPDNRAMTVTIPFVDPDTITVYGADWCGDCRRTKRLLAGRDVPFTYLDAGAPGVREALTAAGYPAIPVVVLPDGAVLMEPSNDALNAALDALPGHEAGNAPGA
jgi:mycoredoxin